MLTTGVGYLFSSGSFPQMGSINCEFGFVGAGVSNKLLPGKGVVNNPEGRGVFAPTVGVIYVQELKSRQVIMEMAMMVRLRI